MIKSQRNNIENNKIIKGDKIIGIDETITQNWRTNNNLKSQVQSNVIILFTEWKYRKSINQRVSKTSNVTTNAIIKMYYMWM